MAKPKFVLKNTHLRRAWTWKKKGLTKKQICEKIGIKVSQYEANTQAFNSYFRRCKQREKLESDTTGVSETVHKKPPVYKNGEVKLNVDDIDVDVLKSWVVCGFNREKIASLLGVSRSTLFNFLKKHPEVERAMDNAVQDVVSDVFKNGLLKLTKDHSIPETYIGHYQGDIVTKKIRRNFRPHLNAIKYLFANTVGWSSEPRPQASNNKGAILKMLDEMANGEDDIGAPKK